MKERATNEAIVKAIALIIIALVLLALAIFVPVSDAHAEEIVKITGEGNYLVAEYLEDGEVVAKHGGVMKLYDETEPVTYYVNPNYPYATFEHAYQKAEIDLMKSKSLWFLGGAIDNLKEPESELETLPYFSNADWKMPSATPVNTVMEIHNPGVDTSRKIRIAATLAWLLSLFILVLMLHVIIRRVRNLAETHYVELDRIRNQYVGIKNLMISLDHRFEEIMAKLGMLPEASEEYDVDPIELQEMIDEKEETTLAALPDYGIDKDWRDTPGYKEESNAD